MILSLNQLNKFFSKRNLTAEEVEIALNEIGLEVEEIKPFSDVSGLLFAKVLEVKDNPNSDRLDIVKVLTKNGELQIQTTNRILKTGDLTVCFPVGATKGEMTFKEVKLKGEISQGMFAALEEIGYQYDLVEEKNQVLVLPNDFATLQDDPMKLLGLDDYLIEISVTANRNDANSYYFLAKELATYFETEFNFELKDVQPTFESSLVVNPGLAKKLSFTEVKGNKVTSLQEKLFLAKHGISSRFSWAVNLTNLCLLFTGAPAHVYDRNTIGNNLIANLYSGELEILGNKKVNVQNVLAIYDDVSPISLACVMGLEKTKASEQTNDFVFEIGVFDPKMVRHGSKEIKLASNSANQGARVITEEVAKLGMQFIRNYCEDLEISQTVNEITELKRVQIKWDDKKLKRYSNATDLVIFDKAKQQLRNLGFEFDNNLVFVPNYRYDVKIFEDLIEEVFRFYSYKQFKPEPYINVPVMIQKRDTKKQLLTKIGYNEARTFTLVSEVKNKLNPFGFIDNLKLMTYVSKEREVVRNSIITSLQEVVEYNQKRKMTQIDFFEKGMVNNNIFVYGFATTTKTFFELRQDVINFLGLNNLEFVPFTDNEMIHPNVSAKIMYQNKMIGWIGKLHPQFDNTNAFYAELLDLEFKHSNKFKPVDFNPLKTIDLTFTLENKDHLQEITNEIKKTAQCFDIFVVDDYQKELTHNITLRIVANETEIQKLIEKYNV
ncbi:phenylalanine--tRNA ligase subunit beta [Mycoplasma hafezii]|uniref:phenylalanine--tRNA ligase subunit beta n=1 Tax=Mycoplasma hafezii TaxID=525886 RepID=UPI003CFB87DB